MKVCGQGLEITLNVHGRERTFSEKELIAILEKHFSNEATKQVSTAKVAQEPTEDKWFEVNPQTIDQTVANNRGKPNHLALPLPPIITYKNLTEYPN